MPFKSLSWNANDSIGKLMITNKAVVFLTGTDLVIKIYYILYMTAITITKNISHYNSRFSLIVE